MAGVLVTLICMCFRFLFGFCSTYQHKKLVFTPNRVTKAQIVSQPDEFPSQWYFQKQFLLKKMSLFWTRILPNVPRQLGVAELLKFGFVCFFSPALGPYNLLGGSKNRLHYQSKTTNRNSWFGFSSLENNLFLLKKRRLTLTVVVGLVSDWVGFTWCNFSTQKLGWPRGIRWFGLVISLWTTTRRWGSWTGRESYGCTDQVVVNESTWKTKGFGKW